MPHAIRIHEYGGPEVMRWEEIPPRDPGRGEVLVRQTAVGLNFIDVYERTGLYGGSLPGGLGREAAASRSLTPSGTGTSCDAGSNRSSA